MTHLEVTVMHSISKILKSTLAGATLLAATAMPVLAGGRSPTSPSVLAAALAVAADVEEGAAAHRAVDVHVEVG